MLNISATETSNLPAPGDPYPNAALSGKQATELENELQKNLGLKNAMGFAQFDGLVAALICGPKPVLVSRWIQLVWDTSGGGQEPAFQSQEHFDRVISLLMQHHNSVAHTLHERSHSYHPAMNWTPLLANSDFALFAWRKGFEAGSNLEFEAWRPLMVSEPLWLERMYGYVNDHKDLEKLSGTVVGILNWWKTRRTLTPPSHRNDLCPCGSGRRFKRCHGSIA
jgi:uncharacterized protein